MLELFPEWVKECHYTRLYAEDLKERLDKIPAGDYLALDIETNSLDRLTAKIRGFSFSNKEGEAFWVPIKTGEELKILSEFTPERTCLFYNGSYDIPILERHGVLIPKFEDVMFLVFLDNPNKRMRGLKEAAGDILGLDMVELKKLFPGKRVHVNFDLLDPEVQRIYGCMDADATWRLFGELSHYKLTQKKIWGLEMALVRPNIEMELNGVDIDSEYLIRMGDVMGDRMTTLKSEIYKLAGCGFELNSPKQISDVLYSKLGLICPRKTRKGAFSTDKDTLTLLQNAHPIIPLLIEVGSLETKKNGFVDKLPTLLSPVTNRLHCSFIQWNVPTGRYSSSGPNLQNVPKASVEDRQKGLNVRDGFVANPSKEANDDPQDGDWVFVDCDYSQIELRVAASISREPVWCRAYEGDADIHQDTAKTIFKTDSPTKAQRDLAKTGNFGILYGQSGYSFAQKMGLPIDEGENFVNAWFAALPALEDWMRIEKERARQSGFAYTFWGRRRPMYLDADNGINCADRKLRMFWERSVISHKVQGSAADIMKLAIVLLRKRIHFEGLQDEIKMLLTVHDQILFKVKLGVLDKCMAVIKEAMEIKISGWVPLKVGFDIGTRWGSCKESGKKA
jgi:DNA polymerase-1